MAAASASGPGLARAVARVSGQLRAPMTVPSAGAISTLSRQVTKLPAVLGAAAYRPPSAGSYRAGPAGDSDLPGGPGAHPSDHEATG